ncbi:hypothetical protein KJ750_01385, partial [Patescibacteria group bacterium]|nr:hypothetical protein [Patescibacteria group bacterium]
MKRINLIKKLIICILLNFGLMFLVVINVNAAQGTITANPQICVSSSKDIPCSTVISWSASGVTQSQVWVSMDGGEEQLFTCALNGSETAPWILPGRNYAFRLYPATDCTSAGKSGSPLNTIYVAGVVTDSSKSYRVAINYHSTAKDFENTVFIKQYNTPAIRALVRSQLQSIADQGVKLIKTNLWLVDNTEAESASSLSWRLTFPFSSAQLANIRQYVQDVGSIQGSDGNYLSLQLSILWNGSANYT